MITQSKFFGQHVQLVFSRHAEWVRFLPPLKTALKNLAIAEGVWKCNNPVFTFKSGKFLTKQKVNLWLSKILSDFTDDNHIFTGHSFRAAIPSMLASHPNKSSVSNIMEWGGWASDSYKVYIKSEKEKRKILFEEIMKCVLSEYD